MTRHFLSGVFLLLLLLLTAPGCDALKNTKQFHEYTFAEWCDNVAFGYGGRCGGPGRKVPHDQDVLRDCLAGRNATASTHKRTTDVDRCNRAIDAMACLERGAVISLAAMPEPCRLPSERAEVATAALPSSEAPPKNTEAPNSASASASNTPPKDPVDRGGPIRGEIFKGTYVCAQGATPFELRMTRVEGSQIAGVFEFLTPKDGYGRFLLVGEYEAARRQFRLEPKNWIVQPPGYVTVGLKGQIGADGVSFSGTVRGPGCSTFYGRRQ